MVHDGALTKAIVLMPIVQAGEPLHVAIATESVTDGRAISTRLPALQNKECCGPCGPNTERLGGLWRGIPMVFREDNAWQPPLESRGA